MSDVVQVTSEQIKEWCKRDPDDAHEILEQALKNVVDPVQENAQMYDLCIGMMDYYDRNSGGSSLEDRAGASMALYCLIVSSNYKKIGTKAAMAICDWAIGYMNAEFFKSDSDKAERMLRCLCLAAHTYGVNFDSEYRAGLLDSAMKITLRVHDEITSRNANLKDRDILMPMTCHRMLELLCKRLESIIEFGICKCGYCNARRLWEESAKTK